MRAALQLFSSLAMVLVATDDVPSGRPSSRTLRDVLILHHAPSQSSWPRTGIQEEGEDPDTTRPLHVQSLPCLQRLLHLLPLDIATPATSLMWAVPGKHTVTGSRTLLRGGMNLQIQQLPLELA